MHALIFTRAADLPAARRVRRQAIALGLPATIARDTNDDSGPLAPGEIWTHFPRRPRLHGLPSALGIAATMLTIPAAGYIKLDADILIRPAAVHWLSQAATGKARGYAIGPITWSGIWAVSAAGLRAAAHWLPHHTRCPTCPEAALFRAAFAATCGITRRPAGQIQVWRPPRPISPTAELITLPSRLTPTQRATALHQLLNEKLGGSEQPPPSLPPTASSRPSVRIWRCQCGEMTTGGITKQKGKSGIAGNCRFCGNNVKARLCWWNSADGFLPEKAPIR